MSDSKIPSGSNLLISLATIPVLAIILGSKAVAEAVRGLGEASEELFRGDRLPVLNDAPHATEHSTPPPSSD